MSLAVKMTQFPTRMAAGAFILNSGLEKWHAKPDHAEHLHSMAKRAFPVVEHTDPEVFARALSGAEIVLGSMLLTPLVPSWIAGAGLTAFSGGLLGLYMRTPGTHEEHGVRPTAEGMPLAKDVWLAAIGVSLLISGVTRIRPPWSRIRFRSGRGSS